MDGFNASGVVEVVEHGDLLADEGHGSLVEATIEGHGTVFSHPAADLFTEVIFEVFGGGP